MELAKVWPLEPGINGMNAAGEPMTLNVGAPGFMELNEAMTADKEGRVQLMAGIGPEDLKKPRTTTVDEGSRRKPGRRRGKYNRSDMSAEA